MKLESEFVKKIVTESVNRVKNNFILFDSDKDVKKLEEKAITIYNFLVENPFYITGFTEGEGSFGVSIIKNNETPFGYQIISEFNLVQAEIDVAILIAIRTTRLPLQGKTTRLSFKYPSFFLKKERLILKVLVM